ncbi:MAG: peptidase family M48-domain-containing protein [Benniella sp.]|nr:MAG: peptidase family M48-domain-containing protein [Benniella sp.]
MASPVLHALCGTMIHSTRRNLPYSLGPSQNTPISQLKSLLFRPSRTSTTILPLTLQGRNIRQLSSVSKGPSERVDLSRFRPQRQAIRSSCPSASPSQSPLETFARMKPMNGASTSLSPSSMAPRASQGFGEGCRLKYLLVPLPFVCLGMGDLEQAPNTGRWRFIGDNELPHDEIDGFLSEDADIVKDPEHRGVQLVTHCLANVLEALNLDELELKPFLCDVTSSNDQTKNNQSRDKDTCAVAAGNGKTLKRPNRYRVYVSRKNNPMAYCFPDGTIVVHEGLLRLLEHKEDLVVAAIAHEISHINQGHYFENNRPSIFNWPAIVSSVDHAWLMSEHHDPCSTLHGRFLEVFKELKNVLQCLTSQVKEHECDVLSMEIMARAGYDPIYALRLYDILARAARDGVNAFSIVSFLMPQNLNSSDNDAKMKRENEHFKQLAMEEWWHNTHPPSRARQQYLIEPLYEVREKFRESEKLRTKPIKRFRYEMVRRRESTNDHVELAPVNVDVVSIHRCHCQSYLY